MNEKRQNQTRRMEVPDSRQPISDTAGQNDDPELNSQAEALRRSEARLAEAQRIARLGNWEWDIEADQMFWSDKVYRIFGLTPDQAEPTRDVFMQSVHPEDREFVRQSAKAALYDGQTYDIDHRIVHSNGTYRIVHEQAEVTFEAGKPIWMVGTVQDVTEQRKIEEARKFALKLNCVMDSCTIDELLAMGLEEAVRLTDSQIGYLHFVNPDQETIALQIWSKETLEFCSVGEKDAHYPIGDAGVWVDCFHQRRPVIHNDYQSLPHKKGLPEGHNPVIRDLGVPVVDKNEIRAIIGVGNKPHGYDDHDAKLVSLLADSIWSVVQRKRTEIELQEANHLLQTIFDHTDSMIAYLDLQANFVKVNRAYAQISGWDPDFYSGKNYFELHPSPSDREPFEQVIQTGEPYIAYAQPFEYATHPERETTYWDWHLAPVKNSDETTVGLLLTLQDVTERTRAEQALVESEERYRLLVEQASNIVYTTDINGNFAYVNPACLGLTGYAETELIGKHFTCLIDQQWRGRVKRFYQRQFLRRTRETTLEFPIVACDGEQKWVEQSITLLMPGERVTGFHGIVRDITKRRQIEEREQKVTEHAQKQEKLAAIGQVAAGIAHDFNNMLTGMMGHAEITLMTTSDMAETTRRSMQTILQQGERASQLIRQILDFSRRTTAQKHRLDLRPFLKETVGFLKSVIPENIHITLNHEPRAYIVNANVVQIQQIVTNLAVNARDAMLSGGRLSIQLSSLTQEMGGQTAPVPGMVSGNWVVISVSDTGVGIPLEVQDHLYEPFYTTKEAGEGTGLGLAQVYGIVQQHDGHIDVKSKVGQGTTFSVYLPEESNTAEAEPTVEQTGKTRGRGETVLVVEDDPMVLDITQAMLHTLGYKVLTAIDGRQALEVYKQHQASISLVLSDMVMPNMGGVELHSELVSSNPSVKLILMSGYPLGESKHELAEKGIAGWLQKPVSLDMIAEAIHGALH